MSIAFLSKEQMDLARFHADLNLGNPGWLYWDAAKLTVLKRNGIYGEDNNRYAEDCLTEITSYLEHNNPFVLEANCKHRHRYGKPAWEQLPDGNWKWVGHDYSAK